MRRAPKKSSEGQLGGAFEKMIEQARAGGHLWYVHTVSGQPYAVTRSAIPPTREELVRGVMKIAEVVCTKVDGVWQYTEPHYPTRAEAERYVPPIRSNETAA